MAEISKEFKIVLIVNAIAAFAYGIMYVFLPDTVYSLNDAPYFDPHFWRLFGGALIATGIATLLGIIKGDWDNIKLLVQFAIMFLIILALISVTSPLYITRSTTNLLFHWLDTIVIIILAVIDIFFCLREEKK